MKTECIMNEKDIINVPCIAYGMNAGQTGGLKWAFLTSCSRAAVSFSRK